MRLFFKGVPVGVPYWVVLLQMTGGDPERAMRIEERVSERWWRWARAWWEERGKADNGF